MDIDIHHAMPLIVGTMFGGHTERLTGIIYRNIKPAVPTNDRFRQLLDLSRISNLERKIVSR